MPSTRRTILAAGGVAITGSGLAIAGRSHSSIFGNRTSDHSIPGTWPEAGYDTANTGSTDASGPTAGVTKRWAYDVGTTIDKTPVVANGHVYMPGHDHLHAVDAATGDKVWSTKVSDGLNDGAAAVANGLVYVGFETTVYTFEAATGTERWRHKLPDYELTAPTVVSRSEGHNTAAQTNGTVYVGCSQNGMLYALDAMTGEQAWEAPIDRWIPGSAAVADGSVYVSGGEGALVALRAEDGTEQWRHPLDRSMWGAVTVADGIVIASSQKGTLYALDATTGDIRWSFESTPTVSSNSQSPLRPGPFTTAAVRDGTVYVGSSDTHLYALDLSNGEVEWSFWGWNNFGSEPAVTADAVYAGCDDTMVYALDPDSGDRRWEYSLPGWVRGGPAVIDDMLFVTCDDDHIHALGGTQ
ncbi:outer membrane protein assembly factor BamB family protein [Haladaptatus sp. NG-SE-30]